MCCSYFYAQARTEEYAAKAVCGPRGEWGKMALPYSIGRLPYYKLINFSEEAALTFLVS